MRLHTAIVALFTFGFSSLGLLNPAASTTIAATTSLSSVCEPIGLILSINGKAQTNRTYRDSLVCANQSSPTPPLPRNATIEFLCYANGQTQALRNLNASAILATCPVAIRKCDKDGGLCLPPQGVRRGSSEVVVITPYERVLPGKPVRFS